MTRHFVYYHGASGGYRCNFNNPLFVLTNEILVSSQQVPFLMGVYTHRRIASKNNHNHNGGNNPNSSNNNNNRNNGNSNNNNHRRCTCWGLVAASDERFPYGVTSTHIDTFIKQEITKYNQPTAKNIRKQTNQLLHVSVCDDNTGVAEIIPRANQFLRLRALSKFEYLYQHRELYQIFQLEKTINKINNKHSVLYEYNDVNKVETNLVKKVVEKIENGRYHIDLKKYCNCKTHCESKHLAVDLHSAALLQNFIGKSLDTWEFEMINAGQILNIEWYEQCIKNTLLNQRKEYNARIHRIFGDIPDVFEFFMILYKNSTDCTSGSRVIKHYDDKSKEKCMLADTLIAANADFVAIWVSYG